MKVPWWMRARAAVEKTMVKGVLATPPLRNALAKKRSRPIDGHVFDPELAAVFRLDDLVGESDYTKSTPQEARVRMTASILAAESAPPSGVTATDRVVADRPARLYTPEGLASPSPAIFFLHGGGFVVGDLDTHDSLCRRLAHHGKVRVVAFDYRLAPEHPYPTAVDDSLAGFRALARDAARYGIDPARIAVAGDSAGGNLSAVIARRTKDDEIRPALQALVYPATDGRCEARSHTTFAKDYLLTSTMIAWYFDHYCPPARRREPNMSPLLVDDFVGLPPAIVYVAGYDPLRDEGISYAERLRAAGVSARVVSFGSMPHGFTLMTALSRAALDATERIAREIGDALRA